MGPLGARTASANSIAAGFTRQTARDDGPIRIELLPEQLRPPNLADEERVFGYASTNQTALHQLTAYLKAEAAEQIPRGWSLAASGIECAKALVERTLEYTYGEPPGMRASIAEPDKLARNTDAQARDNVARFIMRKKRYAAIGIQRRLADPAPNPGQRQASLRTPALISGRKFHRDGAESPGTQAEEMAAASPRSTSLAISRSGELDGHLVPSGSRILDKTVWPAVAAQGPRAAWFTSGAVMAVIADEIAAKKVVPVDGLPRLTAYGLS